MFSRIIRSPVYIEVVFSNKFVVGSISKNTSISWNCLKFLYLCTSVLPRILIRPGWQGIVDKCSLREGPLALIVTFVAECSMIMPLPSWNLSSVTSWQLWVWRTDAWEWGYRNQDGVHEQGVEGNTRNKCRRSYKQYKYQTLKKY